MWHKPNQLHWLANFLYVLSLGMFLYGMALAIIRLPIFPLNTVKVTGELKHISHKQVELIVEAHLTGNFFTLDIKKTRDAFEKLPWTRNVSIRRHWPSVLQVEIEEHQVLARWGDIALVNTYGELFHGASDADLPVFYGAGDAVKEVAEHYALFGKILNRPEMKIAQVTLSPRRAWEIKTNQQLRISLGRENLDVKLEQFANAYETVLRHLNSTIQYADLRYPNGFAVRQTKKLSTQVSPLILNNRVSLA